MNPSSQAVIAASSGRLQRQELRWCLALVLLTWFSGIAAQNVISVGVDDQGVVYTGAWTEQDNGGHKFAEFLGDGFIFMFQGTGISYVSRHNPNAGAANISIDGQFVVSVDESANTIADDEPQEAILFSQSGLDGSQNRTFELSWAHDGQYGGSFVEVYGLEYVRTGIAPTSLGSSAFSAAPPQTATSAPTTGIPSSIASSSPSPFLPSSSSTSHRLTPSRAAPIGGIVGGTVGAVLLFLLVLCFCLRRAARKRQHPVDLKRRAQPYTLHSEAADGRPQDPANASVPVRRNKAAMAVLSEEAINGERHQVMQHTGTGIGPTFGSFHEGMRSNSFGDAPVRADGQASPGPNEGTGRSSASSDNDSRGNPPSYSHPPSYSTGPARYASRILPSVPLPKT